jgi:4-amino-4-deoxy-L-arabinose transferase-like glycosyltransferase
LLIVTAGIVVRALLLGWFQGEPLHIDDEWSYHSIARNLVQQGEFAETPGVPTSLRPPLYPAVVAAVYRGFGLENYQAVRVLQAALSLVMVLVVYLLARETYSRRAALWAVAICCFYPSLLVFNNLLLTEALFAVFLALVCLMVQRFLKTGSLVPAGLAGLCLGLGALTRSVVWLFPPFLAVFLALAAHSAWPRRLLAVALALGVFAAVIAPWSIRNTRLQETFTVIDVMGGRNLMMGNYEYTPLHRPWDAISASGEKAWYRVLDKSLPGSAKMTQGQRDKAAMRYGLRFMAANPGLTAQRCLVKFFHFWQLDRPVIAGLARGWWGHLSKPALVVVALLILGSQAAALIAAIFGFLVVRPTDRSMKWFLLLLVAFIAAMHTVVFAHSRYSLPLMPLVFIGSGAAMANAGATWRQRRSWRFRLAVGMAIVLVCAWLAEIFLIDLGQLRG